MAADKPTLRRNLLLTIGLLWLIALAIIAFTTYTSAGTEARVSRPDVAPAQQAEIDACIARNARPEDPVTKVVCRNLTLPPGSWESHKKYDTRTAAAQAIGATVIAVILAGAAVVWAGNAKSGSPVPDLTPETGTADPASTLRKLKALHDEGILTDAEYETKRQALADQL